MNGKKALIALLMCFLALSASGIAGKHACIGSVCSVPASVTTNTNTNTININVGNPSSSIPPAPPSASTDTAARSWPVVHETKNIAATHVASAARDAAIRSGIYSIVIPDQYGEVALSHENNLLVTIEAAPQQGFASTMVTQWKPVHASPDSRYVIAVAYGETMPANTLESRAGVTQNTIVVYCFDTVRATQAICRYWLDLTTNTVKFYSS